MPSHASIDAGRVCRPEASPGAALVALVPWIVPAVFSVYVKALMLAQGGLCVQCLNQVRLTWAELSYFRSDLLVVAVLVPAVLFVVRAAGGPLAGRLTAALVSTSAFLVLWAQWISLRAVGAFVPFSLLGDALAWARAMPGQVSGYVAPVDVGVLAGGLAAIAAGALWSWHADRRGAGVSARCTTPAALSSLTAIWAAGALVPWMADVPSGPYHHSAIVRAVAPVAAVGLPHLDDSPPVSAGDLQTRLRETLGTPVSRPDARYWASMAGADVVVFVFETGPARSLPIDGDLSEFPVLDRLRARAFIATRHYATAPVTNQGLFSLFSSWYPASFDFDRAFAGARLPGVVSRLWRERYDTAAYLALEPGRMVPGDNERLERLGFERLRYPSGPRVRRRQHAEYVVRERAALALFHDDLAGRAPDDRFLAAFLPNVGHAPWLDITGGLARSVPERGRALMALQDGWLGEIVDALERAARLERTVIVVTADHGIRTRREDPDFPVGMIDEYSFHVPLLIYAPGALRSTEVIAGPTSHVDVAPSVLDLLGLDRDREREQGVPLWSSGLASRTLLQLAPFYLGADGLVEDGRYRMYSYMTGEAYENDAMRFSREHVLADAAARQALRERLRHIHALQTAWVSAAPRDPPIP